MSARSLYRNLFLLYDTECTSNVPTDARCISIGAHMAEFDNNARGRLGVLPLVRIGDGMHSYIHSDKDSDPAAFAVHHITRDKLVGAPKFPEAMEILGNYIKQFLDNRTRVFLVGHNAFSFDNMILFCNSVIHRVDFEKWLVDHRIEGFVDTLPLFRNMFKNKRPEECPKDANGKPSLALGACYRTFCEKETLEGAHDALVDTEALIDVCNSPTVAKTLTQAQLFEKNCYRKRMDGLKQLRSSAGLKFQQDQDQNKRQKQCSDVPPFSEKPVWSPDGQLCLNCLTITQHDQCDLPTTTITSLSMRLAS